MGQLSLLCLTACLSVLGTLTHAHKHPCMDPVDLERAYKTQRFCKGCKPTVPIPLVNGSVHYDDKDVMARSLCQWNFVGVSSEKRFPSTIYNANLTNETACKNIDSRRYRCDPVKGAEGIDVIYLKSGSSRGNCDYEFITEEITVGFTCVFIPGRG